jgi:hypothetical protein
LDHARRSGGQFGNFAGGPEASDADDSHGVLVPPAGAIPVLRAWITLALTRLRACVPRRGGADVCQTSETHRLRQRSQIRRPPRRAVPWPARRRAVYQRCNPGKSLNPGPERSPGLPAVTQKADFLRPSRGMSRSRRLSSR